MVSSRLRAAGGPGGSRRTRRSSDRRRTWNPIPRFRPTSARVDGGHLRTSTGSSVGTALPAPSAPRRPRLPATPVRLPAAAARADPGLVAADPQLRGAGAAFALLSVRRLDPAAYWRTGCSAARRPSTPSRLWLDRVRGRRGRHQAGRLPLPNLSLIVLIPAAMLSIWAVHRIRPRFLSSVAGGLRWRWLLRCAGRAGAAVGGLPDHLHRSSSRRSQPGPSSGWCCWSWPCC